MSSGWIGNLHIHAPEPDVRECVVIDCPTCERQRRAYAAHTPWYGWDITCAGCGDQWQDGEMSERPFAPGWRRKNIEYARRKLSAIGVPA